MFPVDAVFSHCRFVWLSQSNVPVVFLDPGINRTASLPNVNLTTRARYAVDTRSFQSQVILHGPKKIRNCLWRKAHRLDVLPGQHTTTASDGRANKGKKGNRSVFLRCGSGSLRWIQGPSDLPVSIAVPLESVPQEFKFIMKAFVITQGSGPMYQR
jgi:hypothetical protein